MHGEIVNQENLVKGVQEKAPSDVAYKTAMRTIAAGLLNQGYPMFLRGLVIASEFYIRSLYLSSMDDSDLIAANSLVSICDTTTAILCVGCLSTLSPVIGQNLHQRDPEYVGLMFRQAECFAALLSVPVISIYLASGTVMQWLQQEDYVVNGVRDYFSSAVYGFLPLVLMLPQQSLLIGLKKPLRAFATEFTRSVIQIISGYFLVQRHQMGFRGLGYSLSIAASITCVLNTLSLVLDSSLSRYQLFSKQPIIDTQALCYLIKKGVPVGLEYAIDHFSALINTFLISTRGKDALLATQIASQYGLFLSISSEANSQAIAVMVSYAYGEKKFRDCQSYLLTGMCIASVLPSVGLVLFLSKPELFVNLYLDKDEQHTPGLLAYCQTFLIIEGIRQIAKGTQFAGAGTLIGLLDTAFPTKMSVAFVLVLSSSVASALAFATELPAALLYSTRVLGVLLAIAGIMFKFCYHQRTTLHSTTEAEHTRLILHTPSLSTDKESASPQQLHSPSRAANPNRQAPVSALGWRQHESSKSSMQASLQTGTYAVLSTATTTNSSFTSNNSPRF